MAEIIDVVTALSLPVKAGWAAWTLWAAGHVYLSYRDPVVRVPARPAPVRPRRPTGGPAPDAAGETVSAWPGTPDVAPDLVQPAVMPVAAAPFAFDPSNAVIEAFGEPNNELDAFVVRMNRVQKSDF